MADSNVGFTTVNRKGGAMYRRSLMMVTREDSADTVI